VCQPVFGYIQLLLSEIAFKQSAKSILVTPPSLLEGGFMLRVIKNIFSDQLQICKTAHARCMIPDTYSTAVGSGAKEVTSWCGTVSVRHAKHELS
jgi:hypothetical protein